ncbi:MAG: BolA family transcriptional regulator [Betaproteobacteria bacterium]|nr:BolA family transcriptional regulator [Betaproteobacteria bacterium]
MTLIKTQIEEILTEKLNPKHLQVEDESWQHGGGAQAQSHYKVIVVAEQFTGLKLLARHRLVQSALADVVSRIRALSLHTLTAEEWEKAESDGVGFRSPGCHNKPKTSL